MPFAFARLPSREYDVPVSELRPYFSRMTLLLATIMGCCRSLSFGRWMGRSVASIQNSKPGHAVNRSAMVAPLRKGNTHFCPNACSRIGSRRWTHSHVWACPMPNNTAWTPLNGIMPDIEQHEEQLLGRQRESASASPTRKTPPLAMCSGVSPRSAHTPAKKTQAIGRTLCSSDPSGPTALTMI